MGNLLNFQQRQFLTRPLASIMMPAMKILRDIRATFKESGFKGVTQKYGWKLFLAVFVYYLVRDITLYILLPYFVLKGFVTH